MAKYCYICLTKKLQITLRLTFGYLVRLGLANFQIRTINYLVAASVEQCFCSKFRQFIDTWLASAIWVGNTALVGLGRVGYNTEQFKILD